jgi:hypothetical protein
VKQPSGCEVRILAGESPAVAACSLTEVIFVQRVEKVLPVGKRRDTSRHLNDAQGGGPAGDQSSRDGGVVPQHKVPGKIVPRVGSSHWFPGEFLNRRGGPVVKTTVTSPQEREMQVRILQRELCPRSSIGKALNVPWSLIPRPEKFSADSDSNKYLRLRAG